jgi:hypothetical protein
MSIVKHQWTNLPQFCSAGSLEPMLTQSKL